MLNIWRGSRDKYLEHYDLPYGTIQELNVFSLANRSLRKDLVFVSEYVRADSFSIAKEDNLQLMT